MPTISERIQKNAERLNRWHAENPQFETEGAQDEPKVYITREMLASPAFRSLSRVGLLLLLDFFGRREMQPCGYIKTVDGKKKKKWDCVNNGQIRYPYSIALENGFTRRDFRNGIDELQTKGFLDITHLGKGGRRPKNGEGDATTYFMDHRWRDFDVQIQRAVKPPRKPRPPDTRMDRGFQKYWRDIRLIATIAYVKARCKQILTIKFDTGLGSNHYQKRYRLSDFRNKPKMAKNDPISFDTKAIPPKKKPLSNLILS